MVATTAAYLMSHLAPLADVAEPEDGRSLLQRMDPAQRAAVLSALFALVLLGIGLVVMIWLGGRIARRSGGHVKPTGQMASDWDNRASTDVSKPDRP